MTETRLLILVYFCWLLVVFTWNVSNVTWWSAEVLQVWFSQYHWVLGAVIREVVWGSHHSTTADIRRVTASLFFYTSWKISWGHFLFRFRVDLLVKSNGQAPLTVSLWCVSGLWDSLKFQLCLNQTGNVKSGSLKFQVIFLIAGLLVYHLFWDLLLLLNNS